jgi:hypothetical protein
MPIISAAGSVTAATSATATLDTRYSFVGQHLEASAIFVRRLRAIETTATTYVDEETRCEHRGLVCAVVLQCAAALETESHEICTYGPGCHLGTNGTDQQAQLFLSPIAEVIDDQDTVSRFDLILHLLKKQRLERGREPFQSASLVVRLRNELAHYKSHLGTEMASKKLFSALEALNHAPPPFADATMNFFPHRCLSAECAVGR